MDGDFSPGTLADTSQQQQQQTPDQYAQTRKPYAQILDEYGAASSKEPEIAKMSVHDFSQGMNDLTGTNRYDEGLNTNVVRELGAATGRALTRFGGRAPDLPGGGFTPADEGPWWTKPTLSEALGGGPEGVNIPEAFGKLGESAATAVGASPEMAKSVGENVKGYPQMGMNLLLGPAAPVGFGLQTYGETGSVPQAITSAAFAHFIPKGIEAGGQQVLKQLGAKTAGELSPELYNLLDMSSQASKDFVNRYLPQGVLQHGGEILGKAAGMFVTGNIGESIGTMVGPQSWSDKLAALGNQFSPSGLVGSAVGQAPFMLFDAFGAFRNKPVEAARATGEADFTARYTSQALKGDPETGSPPFVPTKENVQDAMKGAITGKIDPNSPTGRVLKSIGSLPYAQDLTTPVQTATEAWPMPQAIKAVQDRTSMMLQIRGESKALDDSYQPAIYSALRSVESETKGQANKEDVTHLAASRVADQFQKDNKELSDVGRPSAAGRKDEISWEDPKTGEPGMDKVKHTAVMEEINRKIDRGTPENPNPDYDPDLHLRVALTSGDPEEWEKAGITRPVMYNAAGEATTATTTLGGPEALPLQVRRQGTRTVPLTRHIIDLFSGMGPKPTLSPDITDRQKELFRLRRELDELKTIENPTPEDQQRMQLISDRNKELKQEIASFISDTRARSRGFPVTSGGQRALQGAIWGSTSAEALRRALTYGKLESDLKTNRTLTHANVYDPAAVTEYIKNISQAMSRAELGVDRIRSGARWLPATDGETEETAQRKADALNEETAKLQADQNWGLRYRAAEKRGQWRVVEEKYDKTQPFTEERPEGVEEDLGRAALEELTEAPAEKEVKPQTLADYNIDVHEIADNFFVKRLNDLDRLDDKAISQARKDALARNVVYFLSQMPEDEFKNVVLAHLKETRGQMVTSIRGVDKLRQRMIKYVQYLRMGGQVDTSIEKKIPFKGTEQAPEKGTKAVTVVRRGGGAETFDLGLLEKNELKGPRLVATDKDQLTLLEKWMGDPKQGGLGFGVESPGHARAGEPRLNYWNSGIVGQEKGAKNGLNFFEQFGALMGEMRKYLPDPRVFNDAYENRPLWDMGNVPRTFTDYAMNNLVVNWRPDEMGTGLRVTPEVAKGFPAGGRPEFFEVRDRQGKEVTLSGQRVNAQTGKSETVNPLFTLFTQSARNQYSIDLPKLLGLYDKYGNLSPTDRSMLTLAQKLVNNSAFVRNTPVGIGIAKDPRDKGYFHTDRSQSSAGIMISPFKEVNVPREDIARGIYPNEFWMRELMTPAEIFPHLMNEIGHTAVDFAYRADDQFKQEVDRIYNYVKEYIDMEQVRTGGQSEWIKNSLHSLEDPREFLAGIFNDGRLHQLLHSIDVPADWAPLPDLVPGATPVQSLFDRIRVAIRNILTRLFGVGQLDGNTMLNRMSELGARGFEITQRLEAQGRLRHGGDIFHQAILENLVPGGNKYGGRLEPQPTRPSQIVTPGLGPAVPAPEIPVPRERPPWWFIGPQDYYRNYQTIPPEVYPERMSPRPIAMVIKDQEQKVANAKRGLAIAQDLGSPELVRYMQEELRQTQQTVANLYAEFEKAPGEKGKVPGRPPYEVTGGFKEPAPHELSGKPMTVTPEGQVLVGGGVSSAQREDILKSREETESSPEFKKWFGESKVVDEKGKPLVVYHVTPTAGFSTFKTPAHFGTSEQAWARMENLQEDDWMLNHALYGGVRTHPREEFLKQPPPENLPWGTYPVYISMKNPLKVSDDVASTLEPSDIRRLKAQGYDGVFYENMAEGKGNSWVPFDPNQIKSAFGNRVFGQSDDILKSRADPQKVIASMRSAATYVAEDRDDIWFRPWNMAYFRDTFAPLFGNRMQLELRGGREGGVIGYTVPKTSIAGLTTGDLARMPPPIVKPYAPSMYESLSSLFRNQGSSPETASAIASQMLRLSALLRNTEGAIWGAGLEKKTKEGLDWLGGAWGFNKMGTIYPGVTRAEFGLPRTIMHEQTHIGGWHIFSAEEPPDVRESIKQVNDLFNNMSTPERQTFLETLRSITGLDGMAAYPAALEDPTEFASEFLAHVGDRIMNVPKPSQYLLDEMRYLPDEMARMLGKVTLRRTQGLGGLQTAVDTISRARGLNNKAMQDQMDIMVDAFKPLARTALDISSDQTNFYIMRNLFPDMYRPMLDQLAQEYESFVGKGGVEGGVPTGDEILLSRGPLNTAIRRMLHIPDPEGKLEPKMSWWDRYLTQFSQLANKYPQLRSAQDMFFNARAIYNGYQTKVKAALAGAWQGNKITDDVRTKAVADFMKRPDLRAAFSKVALDINFAGDKAYDAELATKGDLMAMDPDKVTGWLTPDYTRGLLKKYGVADKDIPTMMTVLDGTRDQIKTTGITMIGSAMHRMEVAAAIAVTRNTDLPPEAARETAQLVTAGVRLMNTNPVAAQDKLMQFQSLIKDPTAYQKVLDATTVTWGSIQQLTRFLGLRMPYFMSERRPGKYGLYFKDNDGKVQSRYFSDDNGRRKYMLANNVDPESRMTNPGDRDYGVSPQVFKQLDEAQARVKEKLVGMFGPDQGNELAAVMDLASDLRTALNSRDVLKTTTGRDLAPGREELDMFGAHQQYVNAIGRAAYNTFVRAEAELINTHPDFLNRPDLKDYINRQVKMVLVPDSPIGRLAQNLGFFYYLFANPSSMIMQSSHQLLGLAPMLTSRGASVAGSYNLIRKANQMFIDSRTKGKYADPVIQEAIDRARKDGSISSWFAQEMDYSQDHSLINRMRATNGQGLWTPFDMLKNRLLQGFDLMRKMYDIVPTYNSEIALIASLLHLRSPNGGSLSGDELYREAQFLRANTMFTGGKENRPGYFQYVPRSAAQAFWNLQTYANGLTTMMGELIRKSVSPKGAGLSAAQAKQVRYAAAQMLITQTAVAGAIALPFGQAILYALQKMFPEHNIEADVREALAGLFGDDEQMGSLFSTAVTSGIPSAMNFVPDVGSRFALAGVFHVSPYSGLEWEQLVGPSGGIAERVLQAGQAGLRGDPMTTVESLMPNGFQRIWKALEQGHNYQTQTGQTLVTDLRPEEIVTRMLGFGVSRIGKLEEYERLSRASEDADKAEHTNWVRKQAQLLKGGDQDGQVQKNITQRVADKGGVYNAQQLSSDIAREYERQNMPVDLRAIGNRATVLAQKKLRSVLGTQYTESPSNTERMQLQQSIAQRLGLGGPRRGSLIHAQRLDQMLQLYPHLNNAQANLLLTHAAASRPSPDLYQELLREYYGQPQ